MMTKPIAVQTTLKSSTGLRPMRSESFPKSGEQMSWSSE